MPVPTQADLKAIMNLEPKQAIAYLERKGFAITWDWHEVDEATHARAFTVAKAARLDILQDIRNALADNLKAGKTLKDFQRELTPTLQAKGWWGKQIIVDSDGNAEKVQLGSPRRLSTIYQTNMQSAYMAGRYTAALAASKTHPYWMYIAINDTHTRPSHRALHGKVFRFDDPIWQYILPPNGYNCRCRFIALTAAEVKRRGLVVESSAGKLASKHVDTGTNKRTGEINTARVAVLRTTDQAGKKITFSPDPGFSGSPIQSHLFDDALYQKAQRTFGTAAGVREVQRVLQSPLRQNAWNAFIDGSQKFGYSQGKTMAFGVMAAEDIAFAKSMGAEVQSGIAYLEDRQLAGPKYRRHTTSGDALTADEWKMLPHSFANAEHVFWDVANHTVLYIFPSNDGRQGKIAIRFNRLKVGSNSVDDAATAYKVTATDIEDRLTRGLYMRIR